MSFILLTHQKSTKQRKQEEKKHQGWLAIQQLCRFRSSSGAKNTSWDAAKSASQALEPKPSKRCWISARRCMGSDTWQVLQYKYQPMGLPSPEDPEGKKNELGLKPLNHWAPTESDLIWMIFVAPPYLRTPIC